MVYMNRLHDWASTSLDKLRMLSFEKKVLLVVFGLLTVMALYIRYIFRGAITPDMTDFLLPWMTHMHENGLAGLGNIVSNYNAPYLILLWLASYLPVWDVTAIKLISVVFDLLLALGVFLVVGHYRKESYAKYASFIAVLFAPVIIQNGALWGQCDSIYTTFIVFSFYAYLKDRMLLMWVMWGLAFAFKLQAIFYAPFLIFLALYHRWSYIGPVLALIVVGLLTLLPALFGKNLVDTFSLYLGQSQPIRTDWGLAWFAPTAYQWTSNEYFEMVRKAGVIFGGAVALGCISLALMRKYSQTAILMIATLILLVLPFVLPTIHERYLFSAEIFLIITAFVVPKFAWAAVLMQIISTMTYLTYFTQANQNPPIPFAWLSLGVALIIYSLGKEIYRSNSNVSAKRLTGGKKK